MIISIVIQRGDVMISASQGVTRLCKELAK